MFIRKYWLPISVFIVAIVGIGLYLLATQPPKEPIKIYKVVEPEKPTEQQGAEVPSETDKGGHVHADGTWHAEPHAPVEVSEAEVSADVQAAPVVVQQADTQIDAATLESAARRLKDPEVSKAWVEWSKKNKKLSEEFFQAAREGTALLPTTEEELERFNNDPEWQRRRNEALHKTAEIYTRMKAHEKENPLLQ
ncbi:hypothetical protein F4009_17810 [Candidatus Poribacteria bacterium]|nr:hypothetical protein [Candidatus Poribacteria bacterium]MYH83081.1 hypothetical protein [Candidatus Poribacteria bacterium]MYK95824.1 hypothetical protein [Candidatus Poribacteria bacterium]